MWIIAELARRLGHDWGQPDGRAGLGRAALARPDARRHELRAARGARRHPVAVPRRGASRLAVPARAPVGGAASTGPPAPFSVADGAPPVDELDDDFPIRLTTGRRLDSYNTGVAVGPLRLAAAPRRDARPLARRTPSGSSVEDGRDRAGLARAAARSRRRCGSTRALRPGLAFMTFHFPDEVDVNHADDRRHRPEVGHGRVQGRRDPRREAPSAPARGAGVPSRRGRTS